MDSKTLARCLTPNAQLARWKAEGRTPVEITGEQAVQHVEIEFNILSGELIWRVQNANGLAALSMMFRALEDMARQFFQATARPKLNGGAAQIAIDFDGERIQLLCEPAADLVLVRGVLAATLLKLQGDEPLERTMNFTV